MRTLPLAALALAAIAALAAFPACSQSVGDCLKSCCDDVGAAAYCTSHANTCQGVVDRGDTQKRIDGCIDSLADQTPEAAECMAGCK